MMWKNMVGPERQQMTM